MIKINLASPDRRRRRVAAIGFKLPAFDLGLLFVVVYIVAVVGVGAAWWLWSSSERRLIAAVQQDRTELAALKVKIGQGAKIKEQLADLKNRLRAIEELTHNQGRSIAILDAFVDTVPPDLWITTLEERGAALKVSGTAFSPTAVADFMSNLRSSGKFKEIDILIARQDLAKNPRPVTFEVTCRFEI